MLSLSGKKILLVRNDNIGDAVLSTPLLEAIKKTYPDSFVCVLCAGYSKEAFLRNPFIDKLFVYEKAKHHPETPRLVSWWRQFCVMLAVRREKFDFAVGVRDSFSRSNASLVRFSGAKTKIVRLPESRKQMVPFDAFIDEPIEGKHEVLRSFDCVKLFDVFDNNYMPFIALEADVHKKIESVIQENGFEKRRYILFHISSRLVENRCSVAYFLRLCAALSVETSYDMVITAAPNSPEADEARRLFCTKRLRFFETTSLAELGALAKECACFVTLDGGAMHYGAVFAPHVVALFGKTEIAVWRPYHPSSVVLQDKTNRAEKIAVSRDINAIMEFL